MNEESIYVLLLIGVQRDIIQQLDIQQRYKAVKSLNTCIKYAETHKWLIIYALELHHEKHFSFISQGGKLPSHCVNGTWGSQLGVTEPHDIYYNLYEQVLRGLDILSDSNDAFYMSEPNEKNTLHGILSEYETKNGGKSVCLYLMGVSSFFPIIPNTILKTAITAVSLGFKTTIVKDMCFISNTTHDEQNQITLEHINIQEQLWEHIVNSSETKIL